MNNIVLNRIKEQIDLSIKDRNSKVEVLEETPKVVEQIKETPISPEELKRLLMGDLNPSEVQKIEESKEAHREFNGIEDFVSFFLPLKEKFTENQIIPLMTLVQAAQIISIGCACKRASRASQANSYFKTFWINNSKTDLLNKVAEVGGFKTITLSTPNEGKFLKFPN